MLCQSLFFNKVARLKPFFRSENTLFTKHLWVTASGFNKTFCIVVVFLLKRTETLCIWCKAFSFIIFGNYRLKIILNRNVTSLLKVAAYLFQALTFTFLCLQSGCFLHQKEGNFRNSVGNVSLSNSFDVHCRQIPILATLSPESNVELLFDLDKAGEVSSNPNSPLLFAIAFCGEMNPGDLSGSLCGEVILWSLSTSLPWLSKIMLNLSFKLKYAAIISWTVNNSCYNDSLCLQDHTKMIG